MGASQAEAAEAAGIGTRTLAPWLSRGQAEPGGRYGAFDRAVGEVYFARRPVAFVRFRPDGGRRQRQIVIPLDEEHLAVLPDAIRVAIERGEAVPTEVVVRFEAEGARGRGDRRVNASRSGSGRDLRLK